MKRIAILAENGFEDLELWYPKLRFLEEGYRVIIASPDRKEKNGKYGYPITPDISTSKLHAKDFDAVIIPGGIKGAELLRMDKNSVAFVKEMFHSKKIVASICHGAWVLISAFIVKGKKITCFFGMKDDLIAAGAKYLDKEVVVDNYLISSRKPADLPAFCKTIIGKMQ